MTGTEWSHVGTAIASTADGAGACIAAGRWNRLGRGMRWIAGWLIAALAADVATVIADRLWRNNQAIGRLWCLASVVLTFNGLALLQFGAMRARIMRAVAAAYTVMWIVLLVIVERPTSYYSYITELAAILIGAAAVATVMRRVALSRHDLLLDPAFLVAVALLAIAVLDGFLAPVAQLWIRSNPPIVLAFYVAKDCVDAAATMVCIRATILASNVSFEPT